MNFWSLVSKQVPRHSRFISIINLVNMFKTEYIELCCHFMQVGIQWSVQLNFRLSPLTRRQPPSWAQKLRSRWRNLRPVLGQSLTFRVRWNHYKIGLSQLTVLRLIYTSDVKWIVPHISRPNYFENVPHCILKIPIFAVWSVEHFKNGTIWHTPVNALYPVSKKLHFTWFVFNVWSMHRYLNK